MARPTKTILVSDDGERWETLDLNSQARVFWITDAQYAELEAGARLRDVIGEPGDQRCVEYVSAMVADLFCGCPECGEPCIANEMRTDTGGQMCEFCADEPENVQPIAQE